MGSLCGKESPPEGHVLDPTTASPKTSLLHSFKLKRSKASGPGRTLGGDGGYNEIEGSSTREQLDPVDARVAAASAAEQRLNNSQKNGRLGSQLEQQKRKTQNQHLQEGTKGKGQQEQLVWD